LRIEVKTGYVNRATGNTFWPQSKAERFDVLAIVLPDRILYKPDLPCITSAHEVLHAAS